MAHCLIGLPTLYRLGQSPIQPGLDCLSEQANGLRTMNTTMVLFESTHGSQAAMSLVGLILLLIPSASPLGTVATCLQAVDAVEAPSDANLPGDPGIHAIHAIHATRGIHESREILEIILMSDQCVRRPETCVLFPLRIIRGIRGTQGILETLGSLGIERQFR